MKSKTKSKQMALYIVAVMLAVMMLTALVRTQSTSTQCDQSVKSDCLGPNCVIGYAYQKTWTCVSYDQYYIISSTGNVELQSGGIYGFSVVSSSHPYSWYCGPDTGGILIYYRIDQDVVNWYVIGSSTPDTWTTQSGVTVYGHLCP